MRCVLRGRFAGLIVLVGTVALLQTGCSADPTASETAEPAAGISTSTASGPVFTVNGPAEIPATGYYTYGAYWEGLYPQVIWYTRTCATLTVDSCTGAWNLALDVTHTDGTLWWNLTRRLVYDCGGAGKKTFQNKVVASGFGQPARTLYKVTKLCGSQPL
jgi:hypothetical protein